MSTSDVLLISEGHRALDPRSGLIAVLHKLFSDDPRTFRHYGDALLAVHQVLNGELAPQTTLARAVNAAIEAAGVDEASLRERYALIKDRLIGFFPEEARPFVKALKDVPEEQRWPLYELDGEAEPGNGDVSLSVGGALSGALEVQAYVQGAAQSALGIDIPFSDALLRIGVDGSLQLRGSLSAPFGSFSAEAQGRVEANYFYQHPSDTYLVSAIVAAADTLVSPWHLPRVMGALAPVSADGHANGFRRIQLAATGSIKLAGQLNVSRSWGHVRRLSLAGESADIGIGAELGAAFSFAIQDQGGFAVHAEPSPAGGLVVALSRTAQSNVSRSLRLGVDAQVTGLSSILTPIAEKFFDDPQGLLLKLRPYTAPGELLKQRITLGFVPQALRADLAAFLIGERTAEGLAPALEAELQRRLGGLLDERVPFWTLSDAAAARSLLDRLADSLGLNAMLRDTLHAELDADLQQKLAAIRKDATEFIDKTVKEAGGGLVELLKPLEAVGEDVQALAGRVKKAAEAVIRFVERYQSLRFKLLAGLERAAELKLSAAITASATREQRTRDVLSVRIVEPTAAATAVYRALMTGDLSILSTHLRTAVDSGAILDVAGEFSAYLIEQREIGFSLHVFGESFSSVLRRTSTVEVSVDAAGSLLVASSRAELQREVNALGETRTATFINVYEMSDLVESRNAAPVPLSVSLSYAEERMEPRELQQFLERLEDPRGGRRLLASGAAAQARKVFDELLASGISAPQRTRVDVAMTLDRSQYRRIALTPDTPVLHAAVENQWQLLVSSAAALAGFTLTARAFDPALSLTEFVLQFRGASQNSALSKYAGKVPGFSVSNRTSPQARDVRRARRMAARAEHFLSAIRAMRSLVEDPVRSRFAAEPNAQRKRRLIQQALDDVNDEITSSLRQWVQVRGALSGLFSDRIPFITVAFLVTLAELAQTTDAPLLLPVLTLARQDGDDVILVT